MYKIDLQRYDFNVSALGNAIPQLLAQASFYSRETADKTALVQKMGKDGGGFVAPLETINYVRNTYGNRRPVCLLEKILREIKRIVNQIVGFVEDTISNIDGWLDDNIPGWEELSEIVEEYFIDPIVQVMDLAFKVIEDTFNLVVDVLTGGC